MKFFKTVFFLIFTVSLGNLLANTPKVYSLNQYSDLYNNIELLQLESGVTALSSTFPYTEEDIKKFLGVVRTEALSSNGIILFNEIEQILMSRNKTAQVRINTEGYYQTNNDNNTWIYDYYNRKPLLEIDLSLILDDYLWSDVILPLQKGMDFYRFKNWSNSNISLLWNMDQIYAQFPAYAVTAIGNKNWNISMGRDLLNYGVGKSGSFSLSDDASYHDMVRGSLMLDKFKYTLTFVDIAAIDLPGLESYVLKTTDGEITESREKLKVLIDHSFEFKPFNNLSLALHESLVRGGGEVYLGLLNPIMIMHNFTLTDKKDRVLGNSISTLSFSYLPIRKLMLYGEFALDQFETPSEAEREGENAKTGEPNAFGYLAGVNYLLNSNNNTFLFNLEYAYTSPYLYRSTTSWSIYALTRYYHSVYNDSNDILVEPLGYKEGPDTQLIRLGINAYLLKRKLNIDFEYLYVLKGEGRLDDCAESGSEAFNKTTPSGDTLFTKNIASIKGNYTVSKSLSFYSQLGFLYFINADNISGDDVFDFQTVLGATYKF